MTYNISLPYFFSCQQVSFHNIPGDMLFIGFKNCAILIILLSKISSLTANIDAPNLRPLFVYYSSKNDPISTTHILEPLRRIGNLTVDLRSSVILKRIDVTYESLEVSDMSVRSSYNDMIDFECAFTADNKTRTHTYFCKTVVRILRFEGSGMTRIVIDGYETKLEMYFGCFHKHFVAKSTRNIDNLQDCDSNCGMIRYFAINAKGQCICLRYLTELVPVNLSLCSTPCLYRAYQICGSDSYFSVYSRDGFKKNQLPIYPPWECLYSSIRCPVCPAGRIGYNCEFIKCHDNNGNCDDLKCQQFKMWESEVIDASVCTCDTGFHITNDLGCGDIDECSYDILCDTDSTYCSNNHGSFTCECVSGHKQLDQYRCEDIDECLENLCDKVSTQCTNTRGSFYCDCSYGFRRLNFYACQDIDECYEMTHNCGKTSICDNIPGSFQCNCPEGTVKSVYLHIVECHDKDECSENNRCNLTVSVCMNLPFHYTCQCLLGFVNIDEYSCEVASIILANVTSLYDDYYEESDYFTTESFELSTKKLFYEVYMMEIMAGFLFIVFILVLRCLSFMVRRKDKSVYSMSNVSVVI